MSALKKHSVTWGIFIAVFILGTISAQDEIELPYESDLLESIDEFQELLRNVQIVYEMKVASKVRQGTVEEEEEEMDGDSDVQADPNGCNCRGLECSCCARFRVRRLKINVNCCFSVSYLQRKNAILVKLTVGSRELFSKEISVRRPPPLCVGIPFLSKGGSVCLQFYNLKVAGRTFSGCGRLVAKLLSITVGRINLGCFRTRFLNATQQVGEVDLPYLEGEQAKIGRPKTTLPWRSSYGGNQVQWL